MRDAVFNLKPLVYVYIISYPITLWVETTIISITLCKVWYVNLFTFLNEKCKDKKTIILYYESYDKIEISSSAPPAQINSS